MPQAPKSQTPSTPVVVLLGGPGSGKGTHGQALASALGYEHVSLGDHFRDHIRRGTPLGRQAGKFIENGQLVPDAWVTELMGTLFRGCPTAKDAKGVVLDGYPRSLAQAETLEGIAAAAGCAITVALYLAVSDDETVRRLSGRLTCGSCGRTFHETSKPPARPGVCDACGAELLRRADDEPTTIRRRIALFHEMIGPLLGLYRGTGRLVEIAAEGTVGEVSARVIAHWQVHGTDEPR
ncbi:MAG: nucleoside monophosphate kinase [Verrucomicrobiaceae bacterium]|nr:MAG: nucleoside monophosphate kinase [Verrucomicrobiaceae bacterium]